MTHSKSDSLTRWLQILSNLAVFLGLVMIGLEMKQNFLLSQSQLISDGNIATRQNNFVMMGENPAIAVAKSINDPESLSHAERLVVGSYLNAALSPLQRMISMRNTGAYTDDLFFMDKIVPEDWMNYYFGNSFAKAWFRTLYSDVGKGESELLDTIASKLDAIPDDASANFQRFGELK